MSQLDLVAPASQTKIPRGYQVDGALETEDLLINQGLRRLFYKAPTGCGKTFSSKLISLSNPIRHHLGVEDGRPMRILFISNKHRLNRQALAEYDDIKEHTQLMVHSAFSEIPQHVINQGWDMCYIDEGHHEAMMSIQYLLGQLIEKPIIAFSADDERGDGALLKFERTICPITERDAALAGYIEKVGVNTVLDTGKADKSILASSLVDRYHQHMGNTIAFFKTNAEASAFHSFLRSKDLPSFYLSTTATENDMDNALEALALGEIQFLVNCNKVGEGVDCAQVSDVIMARHFYTKTEKRQLIGRAIRPDSPCAAWEFQNPIKDTVSAVDVVGATKYERLLYLERGQWRENLFSGEDPTWGQMSKLRANPDNPNPDWGTALREARMAEYERKRELGATNVKPAPAAPEAKPKTKPAPKRPAVVGFPTSNRVSTAGPTPSI